MPAKRSYDNRPEVKAKKRAYNKQWRIKNRDKRKQTEAKRRITKRAQCLVSNCRTRARRRGIEYALDSQVGALQAIINKGKCQITGTPFNLVGGRTWNSPSIDRIDPSKGYVPDNVRVVCHAMNAAMSDWGEDKVWEMLQNWQSLRNRPKSS